jgi:large subunit ribosomal protein L23
MIKPLLTEKSLDDAKNGKYTFWVDRIWNKHKIAEVISKTFEVTVTSVRTINYKQSIRKNYLGRKRKMTGGKKAIVTLSGKGKIDLFESKK